MFQVLMLNGPANTAALNLSRIGLLVSTCVAALIAGSAAIADPNYFTGCAAANATAAVTCTVPTGAQGTGVHIDFTGTNGTNGVNAAPGGNYTLNNMADFTTAAGQNEGLFVRLRGGVGNADVTKGGTRGGDGGVITITNSGMIAFGALSVPTTEGTDDGSNPGVWDDPGRAVAIYAASIGGTGGGGQGSVGGGDGGNGGHAGPLTITNSGTLAMTGVTMAKGGAGILGSIVTGGGGEQNDTAGDQHGGAAGDGEALTITNNGLITLSAPSAAHYVWGIGAENIGGVGGKDNGEGGNAGTTTITNTGVVSVTVQSVTSTDVIDEGVRGIYGASFGGPGEASSDGSDDGGIGEGGSAVSISTSANVSVTANGLAAPQDGYNPTTNDYATDTAPVSVPANLGKVQQSGVLVAVSKGGDGGSGPQTLGSGNNAGGQGANAGAITVAVTDGAVIAASGNYVAGVVELSFGGLGGDGREDSDGAVAGNGGAVGILMDGGTSITTNGADAYGVAARSQGGNGGDYIPSSGTINTNAARAGQGGAGGELNLTFGDVVNDQLGAGVADASGRVSIHTAGDNASGIIAQSIGGAGGNVGNSFDLFGQVTDSTGAGGNAGAVFVRGGVDVATTGNAARGVVLQSIGGAGGMGGDSSGLIVLGGSSGAGTGGAAGQTSALLAGTVRTQGTSAAGVLAQSIGGGGGVANSASGVVAVGGQGGIGGATADAGITFAGGLVSTAGDYAYGIEVQSIGGGGGDGGAAFSFAGLSAIPTVGVGGTGGVAGNAAAASVSNLVNGVGNVLTLNTAGANAHAVLAQSIGGGGGSGGDANGGGLTIASFQIAGGGNSGGAGGAAQLSFDGLGLTTSGTHAAGLVAQSIGGGGGTGGSAYSHDTAAGFTLAVGVGGEGGTGGNGGTTTVDLVNTTISTGAGVGSNGETGNTITDAFGVVAQSVGGGGGMGGSSTARAIDVAVPVDDVSFGSEVSVAVGGSGGGGGNGGVVTVSLDGTAIQTQGDGSIGIVAQAIGGGGGIGGSSDAIGRVLQQSDEDDEEQPTGEADDERGTTSVSAAINVGVGGAGGTGGNAGSVSLSLNNASSVTTYGENANAILAQAIGGGGGLGAVGSAQTKGSGDETLNLNIGVGGKGSGGGLGGFMDISLSADSTLTTFGDGSRGVLLQSIGGGGGASQSVSVDVGSSGLPISAKVSVGRAGAGGGIGGIISASFDGLVVTHGADADGILVQSIGGGGGLGGSAGGVSGGDDTSDAAQLAAASEDDSDSGINVNIAIQGAFAGNGGDGGNGGAIGDNDTRSAEFSLGGTVLTYGDYSDGVVVQSIGGGGGAGGNAASQNSEATVKTNIVIGSVGGGAGNGGSITLAFDNLAVQTQGAYAFGALLQSIGAGGGQGGSGSKNSCGLISLGSGNAVDDYSGSSPGCGTLPSASSIRNQTGTNGNGDDISTEGTDNVATIATAGDDAHALVAQSIGGGGGTAGAGSSNSDGDQAFTVALGSSGGAIGNGGRVTLGGSFRLGTSGERAIGLVAQSIGGGGGLATLDMSNAGSGEAHLGADGASGSGAAVSLELDDESFIQTTGQAGHGIVAQSIGGGGGIAGDTSVSTLLTTDFTRNDATNSGAVNGNGGTVTITSAATIQVSGKGAIGIVAQSIAGGGGLGGDATGSFAGSTSNKSGASVAEDVTITNNGVITATGDNGIGIFAQSQGPDDNGVVVVDVNGTVTGGNGAQGAGILIAGGTATGFAPGNTLNVASGATVGALGGTAVIYQGDTNAAGVSGLDVNNAGTISGNINGYYLNGSVISGLDPFPAAFAVTSGKAAVTVNNIKGGVLVDAASYGADVINAGALIVGKADVPDTLEIAGRFTQTSTGVTTTAVDFFRGAGDLIKVSGDVALDGALEIVPLTTYKGARQQIVQAEGEIAGAFSEIKSTLFTYALSTDEDGDLWVEVAGAHFASVPDLTENQQATAAYLGEVFDTKDVTLRELFAAAERVASADLANYATLLSELGPGASAAGSALNIALAPGRFDPLMGCQNTVAGSETDPFCIDVFAKGQSAAQDGGNSALGFNSDIYSFGVAAHQAVGDYVLGASLSLENSFSTGSDGLSNVDGDSVILGLSASRDFGGMTVTGALLGSTGSFDTSRTLALPGGVETARGSYDATSTALRLRLEGFSTLGVAYLRPMLDLDAIYTSAGGYTETGAGTENLMVQGSNESAFIATPAVELGRVFDLGNGQDLRAYGRVGWAISNNDAYTTTASFAGAPASVAGFDTALAMPDNVGVIGAGMQLTGNDSMQLDLRYDGTFGEGTSSSALSLWFSKKF